MRRLFFFLPVVAVAVAAACETYVPEDDDDDDDGDGAGGATTSSSSSTKSSTAVTTASTTVSSTSVVSSTAMSVSSSTGMVVPVPVGAECAGNGDCGTDGICARPTDDDPIFGGGPAHGYCTKDCTANIECGAGNVCITFENTQRCLQGCDIGPELQFLDDELDLDKCWGREDSACREVGPDSVCVPTCGQDSQCPAGRFCDPFLSVCVDTPSTGLPSGSACDPALAECAGVCVDFGTFAQCSNNCVLGGELVADDCGGLEEGLCIFSLAGYGAGDGAFCTQSCQTHADCLMPLMSCFELGLGAGVGYCFAPDPCPNGQADCSAIPGTECTTTPDGPLCLDPAFPLQ